MTSEVCLMNRRAAVLAADSAVTIQHWDQRQGKYVERYFKGANKIFQLSAHHPVGMMIFDSADILRVPWEIIAKDFRQQLEAKSFNTLEEYVDEFFEFLASGLRYFPEDIQNDTLISVSENAALNFLHNNRGPDDETDAERLVRLNNAIASKNAELDMLPFIGGLSLEMQNAAITNLTDRLIATVKDTIKLIETHPQHIPEGLAQVGLKEVFKRPENWLAKTGLVFAGFGDHDVFPKCIEYNSYGIISSRHIAVEGEKDVINHMLPASIRGFAQTSMIDTFTIGLSEDVFYRFAGAERSFRICNRNYHC